MTGEGGAYYIKNSGCMSEIQGAVYGGSRLACESTHPLFAALPYAAPYRLYSHAGSGSISKEAITICRPLSL
jgi:hypothetical protein